MYEQKTIKRMPQYQRKRVVTQRFIKATLKIIDKEKKFFNESKIDTP